MQATLATPANLDELLLARVTLRTVRAVKRPPTPDQVRAGLWALRALRTATRGLRDGPVEALRLPAPPALGLEATRGVLAALWLGRATCLQQSVVSQRWYAEHGVPRDVVIGVSSPSRGFKAHAWLEEPGQLTESEYTPITRLPALAGTDRRGAP